MENLMNAIKALSNEPAKLNVQLAQQAAVYTQQSPATLSSALAALDPVLQSLGYLYFLDARGGHVSPSEPDEAFVDMAASFCHTAAEEQIREAPERFVSLCRKLKEHCCLLHHPRRTILPLLAAVGKLAPSPAHITPLHADLFQMCMLAKCFSAALPALSRDALEIDPRRTALTARDFQLYCYYGGMVFTGVRRYADALELFLYGLTAPTMVLNAITMCSYKKYILVSLLHTGAFSGLPKYTPGAVVRAGKSECAHYLELANAYAKGPEDVRKAVTSHQQTYVDDGNAGLVKLAMAARTKRAVQRLTQTYLTLSLADIASQVGLAGADEAEAHILRMIDAGEVFARIDTGAGMVRFLEDPEGYDSARLVGRIDAQMRAAMAVGQHVKELNQRVASDKQYLNKVGGGKEHHPRFEDPGDLGAEQMAYSFST